MSHYEHGDLAKFAEVGQAAPHLAQAFFAWYAKVFEEGALTKREKSLIALAVAHAVQCPYCIEAYSTESLATGSNLEEMTEALHVAAAIKGGATLVHGVQMRKHAAQVSM